MNIRLIGAVLIVVSCGGFGFCIAASYRRELAMLRSVVYMTEMMESELSYRMLPLPELCKKVGKRVGGSTGKVLDRVAKELDHQIQPDALSCMHSVLSGMKDLPVSVRRLLVKLGSTLGQYDLSGQLQGLRSVRESCCRMILRMEQNRDNKTRTYQTLGLCAGTALVIVLI